MNSINIITARVSPPPSPGQSRSNSIASLGVGLGSEDQDGAGDLDEKSHGADAEQHNTSRTNEMEFLDEKNATATEETPLLSEEKQLDPRSRWWHSFPRDVASRIVSSIRWVFATLASPGVYLIACFYNEDGSFAPLTQAKKLFVGRNGKSRGMGRQGARAVAGNANGADSSSTHLSPNHFLSARPPPSYGSSSSGMSSESESEEPWGSRSKHARSKSLQPADESNVGRRSIRIKVNNDEAMRERKHKRTQSALARTKAADLGGEDMAAHLKSPTSPVAALTKYPKTPAPPRPLVPRRQPSYLNFEPPVSHQKKTLILDLDETLIHSMSRGGRMSTGHMVEVRLNTASLGMGGGASGAAQHPILYWVNKRPYCDEFLRRICKWFNLVIFTASVQEYADPVIDWLEQERKFFSARYYRQHCTFRQGAYIKDLSTVEPDLSKVMILDNSPLSYLFHEDNAIPIQGWINDPTDTDLMHLVPLLEGLQYVHDVRALLALRGGEDGQYTV